MLAEYLSNGLNATQAYRTLHPNVTYGSAKVSGHEWLTRASVQEEITRILTENLMSSITVLTHTAEIAGATMRPFIKIDADGFAYMNMADEGAQANLHLIKKFKGKRERRVEGGGENAEEWEGEWVEVELYDRLAALKLMGQYYKLWSDKMEVVHTLNVEGLKDALRRVWGRK